MFLLQSKERVVAYLSVADRAAAMVVMGSTPTGSLPPGGDGNGLGSAASDPLFDSWVLYFPFEEFSRRHAWAIKARTMRVFFQADTGRRLLRSSGITLEQRDPAHADEEDLRELDEVTEVKISYPEFAAALHTLSLDNIIEDICGSRDADATLNCIGLALCSLRRKQPQRVLPGFSSRNRDTLATVVEKINVRLMRFRPITRLRRLKADRIGTYVAVRGTVLRVSGVRPLVRQMDFSCSKCGVGITRAFLEGKFSPPNSCETDGCKSRTFRPDRDSAITVDYQSIVLQESIDEQNGRSQTRRQKGGDPADENSNVPRTMTIEFMHELVDTIVPGDLVTISGVVKALNIDSIAGRGSMSRGRGRETGLLMLLLGANAVEKEGDEHASKASARGSHLDKASDIKSSIATNLTDEDVQTIASIATNYGFPYLVHSLCPTIFGNELVKAGILLCLAGGSAPPDDSSDRASSGCTRSEAHALIVGDPGLGKSQMLKAASRVAPRGVYVCGQTSSATGLTAVMAKSRTGEFTLEAGALVLADKGTCFIDEFDKMKSQHSALLEAMEQQSISIAKAGVVCTLCARASVIAAANPKGGHYNRARTIGQNLNMEEALLSRFDLIFILLDTPNTDKDDMLADHIMGVRGGRQLGNATGPREAFGSAPNARLIDSSHVNMEPLSKRLARDPAQNVQPLRPSMLRKYLAYAKMYCRPTLSKAACRALQKFYLELRQNGASEDTTPITTRQLESLVRLAQARAKLELRSLVTAQDAADIISLMRECVMDDLAEDDGLLGFQDFSAMVDHRAIKKFGMHLRERGLSGRRGVFTFSRDELKQEYVAFERSGRGGRSSSQRHCFQHVFSTMVDQRYLLKKNREGVGTVYTLCDSLQGT